MRPMQDVVLFRGEADARRLAVDDGRMLVLQLLEYYVNDADKYRLVETFNHRPRDFDVRTLIPT
jgi:hypothetical protein